jgi:hypothetical protein
MSPSWNQASFRDGSRSRTSSKEEGEAPPVVPVCVPGVQLHAPGEGGEGALRVPGHLPDKAEEEPGVPVLRVEADRRLEGLG